MSVEVAKQAIDFLVKHSENSKEISIGFYGGEPLLEVPLIREVVDYAEGVFSGKKLLFNMTTNATLLNIETAKYLYEKKFNVTISLDGPKATHDSNRIFANSNKGTFDAVMQNLEWNAAVIPKMFFLSDSIFVQHLNCLRKRPVLSNFHFPCLGRRIIYRSVSAG